MRSAIYTPEEVRQRNLDNLRIRYNTDEKVRQARIEQSRAYYRENHEARKEFAKIAARMRRDRMTPEELEAYKKRNAANASRYRAVKREEKMACV